MVDLFEDDQCVVSSALQYHQNSDVELHDIFSLWVAAIALTFILACDEIIEFFEGVECRLLAAICHVLADAEVWLVGVDVGRVRG